MSGESAAFEGAAASAGPSETTETLTESTSRVRVALEDLLTTVRSYKEGAEGYFAEQLDRGVGVLEQLKSTAAAIGTDAREYSVNKLNDLTSQARGIAAEVYAKANALDEQHQISERLKSALDEVKGRTSAVFAEVSTRMQIAKSTVTDAASAVKGRIASSGGAEGGSTVPASEGTEIRTVVMSLLASLEDVVHQLKEHKKVIEARDAVTTTSDAVRKRSADAYEAAHRQAVGVLNELHVALAWIVNLPPMTMEELKKLAEEGSTTPEGSDEAVEAKVTNPKPKRWISTVAGNLLRVIEHVQTAVHSVTEYLASKPDGDEPRGNKFTHALEASKSRALALCDTASSKIKHTVAAVGTRAADAAIRTALSVDRSLGVSTTAAAVDDKYHITDRAHATAAKLNERFSIAERYASALSKLGELDKRFMGGLGASVVLHGHTLAEQGLEFVGDRYRSVAGGSAAAAASGVTSASTAHELAPAVTTSPSTPTEAETTVTGVVPPAMDQATIAAKEGNATE